MIIPLQMKKLLLTALLAVAAIALMQSCGGSRKHHGYVSKYPCHQIHPCSH